MSTPAQLNTNKDSYSLYIRKANDVAVRSQKKGNHPFGAVFVIDGEIFEAENTVITDKNKSRHAEMNLVDLLSVRALTIDQISRGIVFASTEPCTMCGTALINIGVKHIVYGCSALELAKIAPWDGHIDISMKELASRCISGNTIKVDGPILEEVALAIHQDFWPKLHNTHS